MTQLRRIAALLLLFCGLWLFTFKGNLLMSLTPAKSRNLALLGARIYPAPEEKAIIHGVVLIRDGQIAAVDKRENIQIPRGTTVLDCTGLTLVAGFWNSHVHFTEAKWEKAATLSSSQLTRQLQEMFSRFGFTTVFDTGSFLENTKIIRERIEAGEVEGPRILSTGPGLVPKDGTPYYVKPFKLPEVDTPVQAATLVRDKIMSGADAIKIFSAPTPIQGKPTLLMPLELIQAITAEAHRHGKWVFAHPENDAGVNLAVEGGVDILAHTAPTGSLWSGSQVAKLKRSRIALIPTLSLWKKLGETGGEAPQEIERFLKVPLDQVRLYSKAGGPILFGTDIGFIIDYDPTEEYRLMARAGMSFPQILASLTTAPAERFGGSRRTGRIAPGMAADIVLLNDDPAADIRALLNVRYTLRKGQVIYDSKLTLRLMEEETWSEEFF